MLSDEPIPVGLKENDEQFWLAVCEFRKQIKKKKIRDIDSANHAYRELIAGRGEDLLNWIAPITIGLHLEYPDFFMPYGFILAYLYLDKIAELFEIELPKIPSKNDIQARMEHYADINRALYDFRILHSLNPAEMCAFLYNFALQFIEDDESDLPAPSQVWLLIGSANGTEDYDFLESVDKESSSHWQINLETRRGDILVMYVASPHSLIHSIWRATTDGFVDPFFYFYTMGYIARPIKTKPISFKEMKTHKALGQNKYVLANLQGASGKALSSQDYNAILELLKVKGQNVSKLPQLPRISFVSLEELDNERAVEEKLVEPFLKSVGYTETDWKRQLSVKMGRGERYYPDYVFGLRGKTREESVTMVLEAKFSLSRERDVRDAYLQMRTYATRLQAKIAMLAAREGIWVFLADEGNFQFEKREHWNWDELKEHVTLNAVRKKIGKT
jgi:hypothetical protein